MFVLEERTNRLRRMDIAVFIRESSVIVTIISVVWH